MQISRYSSPARVAALVIRAEATASLHLPTYLDELISHCRSHVYRLDVAIPRLCRFAFSAERIALGQCFRPTSARSEGSSSQDNCDRATEWRMKRDAPFSLVFGSHFARQQTPVKNHKRRNPVVPEHPHSVHGIVDIPGSKRDDPVNVQILPPPSGDRATHFVVGRPRARSSAQPYAPRCSQTYARKCSSAIVVARVIRPVRASRKLFSTHVAVDGDALARPVPDVA